MYSLSIEFIDIITFYNVFQTIIESIIFIKQILIELIQNNLYNTYIQSIDILEQFIQPYIVLFGVIKIFYKNIHQMIRILILALIKYFVKWIIYGFKHMYNQFKRFPSNSSMFYIFLFLFSITQL